jgi:hypothetical protein
MGAAEPLGLHLPPHVGIGERLQLGGGKAHERPVVGQRRWKSARRPALADGDFTGSHARALIAGEVQARRRGSCEYSARTPLQLRIVQGSVRLEH